MVIILLAIAVVLVSALLAGLALVSMASLREDSAHSLAYRPAGPMQALARRVLGFHGDAIGRRPGGRLGIRGRRGNDDTAALSDDDSEHIAPEEIFAGVLSAAATAAQSAADQPDIRHLVS